MGWIYLSPHLDDVALSCGGLLWQQAQGGDTPLVWTICTGDPPPGSLSAFADGLHTRWGTGREAMAIRRQEDAVACDRMGASFRHFSIADCIYRRSPVTGEPLYASESDIFDPLHPHEDNLLASLHNLLMKDLPAEAVLVCPLTLGGHVDHRLTRAAAQRLGRPMWYYADYPYVERKAADIPPLLPEGWVRVVFPISETALQAWVLSVAAYKSQISTFWSDVRAMEAAIHKYRRESGGVPLWGPPLAGD